nr:unnamed protein product [Callosobruchus analis]
MEKKQLHHQKAILWSQHLPSHYGANIGNASRQSCTTGHVHSSLDTLESIFLFQATVTVYNATMASIYVSILTTLLIEAIIQVACLKERLQYTEDKKQLVKCIKCHLEVVMFVERLQQICKVGLSIVFINGVTFIELVFMIPYLTELIMIIYIHCFYGSILASECEGIAYSLFCSKWINTDVPHKRTIFMFMMFSKKQLTIKLAGGMLTMTLPLFVQVCSIIFYREMQ